MRSRFARARSYLTEETSFAVVAFTVVFGSLLGIVALQTMIIQTRVQLDSVNAELQEAQESNQTLRIQVIELEAPDRVLEVAVGRLGMERPDERFYLPGIDPEVTQMQLPTSSNPFGPAPLSAELRDLLGLPAADQ